MAKSPYNAGRVAANLKLTRSAQVTSTGEDIASYYSAKPHSTQVSQRQACGLSTNDNLSGLSS
jgi:hypothetical protein